MEINRSVRCGDNKVDDYITLLEDYLLSFDTSNIKKLIVAADLISGQIANDLQLIALGKKDMKLNILSAQSDDKTFDRCLKIIEKINAFKSVSDIAIEMKPTVKGDKEAEKIDLGAPKAELAPRAKRI